MLIELTVETSKPEKSGLNN